MAETINMPKLGFDMAEGTLVRWLKKVGETVTKGEVLAEIETDKATVEVESSAGGVVRKLLVDEGTPVPVGSPIAVVGTADEKIDEAASSAVTTKMSQAPQEKPTAHVTTVPVVAPMVVQSPATTDATGSTPDMALKASPLAKRLAREKMLDISNIKGSGPGGRIVRKDIENALSGEGVAPAVVTAGSLAQGNRLDQMINLSRLRQAIARRMTESKTTVPHFYVTHEYRMDDLMALRAKLNALLPESEKLSINDFIVKAAALALVKFPNINASFQGTSLVQHRTVNIGNAVSVEGGLLTVVCREADRKPLRQISAEVRGMAVRAREGKVKPEEIEGSTFSISNLGMYDVENFEAIINPPEAAILAVGSAREVPVVEAGVVKAGWRMKVTLSVDHRVSDGAEGARFLQTVGEYLEQPLKLVL